MLHEEVALAEGSFETKGMVRIPLRLQEVLSKVIVSRF
jgi:hypothetical protein